MNPGDLTTLDNVKQWLGLTGLAVSAITQANPAVLTLATKPNTPLVSGLSYTIEGATGMVQLLAGDYPITVIDPLNFSIPIDSTLFSAYTGGATVAVSDPLTERLISSCSTYIQSWLNRTIANADYVATRSGQGGQTMMMEHFPITSVAAVTIDGITVPPRPPLGVGSNTNFVGFGTLGGPAGFTFDPLRIMLTGLYQFVRGFSNVVVTYAAGFLISNEAQTIPASTPFTLATQQRWSAGDRGVTYANGTALAKVASAPAQGQYSVSGSIYTFNALDAGKAVLISYAYVPFDLEQATIDMIGDWFKYRDRVGKTSEGIEGMTITFVNSPIPVRALGVMQQYKRVAPIYL